MGYIGFHGTRVCLMAADTDDELYAMADRLGLKRIYFGTRSHAYFIPEVLKDKALEFGAVLTERKAILEML